MITNFNSGETQTFPLFIWGAARQGIPPQVNVIATALLAGRTAVMVLNLIVQRRRSADAAPAG